MKIESKLLSLARHLQSRGFLVIGHKESLVLIDAQRKEHLIHVAHYRDDMVAFVSSSDFGLEGLMSFADSLQFTKFDLLFHINFPDLKQTELNTIIGNALSDSYSSFTELFYRSMLSDIKKLSLDSQSDIERMRFLLIQAKRLEQEFGKNELIGDIDELFLATDEAAMKIEAESEAKGGARLHKLISIDPIHELIKKGASKHVVNFEHLEVGQLFMAQDETILMVVGRNKSVSHGRTNSVIISGVLPKFRGKLVVTKPDEEVHLVGPYPEI